MKTIWKVVHNKSYKLVVIKSILCWKSIISSRLSRAALTRQITGWVKSRLLKIGVLHIAFPEASPIWRAFEISRLRRPVQRGRGLVRANLVALFLTRPYLASFQLQTFSSSCSCSFSLFVRLALSVRVMISSIPFSLPTLDPAAARLA